MNAKLLVCTAVCVLLSAGSCDAMRLIEKRLALMIQGDGEQVQQSMQQDLNKLLREAAKKDRKSVV